jgi:hypothetical protein
VGTVATSRVLSFLKLRSLSKSVVALFCDRPIPKQPTSASEVETNKRIQRQT